MGTKNNQRKLCESHRLGRTARILTGQERIFENLISATEEKPVWHGHGENILSYSRERRSKFTEFAKSQTAGQVPLPISKRCNRQSAGEKYFELFPREPQF